LKTDPPAVIEFPGAKAVAALVKQVTPLDAPGWPVVGLWVAPAKPAGAMTPAAVNAARQSKRRVVIITYPSFLPRVESSVLEPGVQQPEQPFLRPSTRNGLRLARKSASG
jgi:hypothetical protein